MAKKKVTKVPHEKAKVHHGGHKKKSGGWMLYALIALVVVAAAGYYFFAYDKVLATVNGEKVLKSEVDDQYKGLASQYGDQISYDVALNQTIIEKILLQEASKKGIVVSDAKLDAFIAESLAKTGSTTESFKKTLKEQNMTYESIRERIRVQLAITDLINKTFADSSVTDAETKAFFDGNKQLFSGQSYATVKGQIADYLKSQKQVKEFQYYVQDLRNKADVQIK